MTFFLLLQPDLESGELELEFPRLKCNLRKTVSGPSCTEDWSAVIIDTLLGVNISIPCWWCTFLMETLESLPTLESPKPWHPPTSDNNVSLASRNPSLWNVTEWVSALNVVRLVNNNLRNIPIERLSLPLLETFWLSTSYSWSSDSKWSWCSRRLRNYWLLLMKAMLTLWMNNIVMRM